ncbi:hypothetical protein HDU81_002690 [Chytriomyces hyalinus]|nr:hypothetical protein HDU81_002690 [Chytriomyces hyalinus]
MIHTGGAKPKKEKKRKGKKRDSNAALSSPNPSLLASLPPELLERVLASAGVESYVAVSQVSHALMLQCGTLSIGRCVFESAFPFKPPELPQTLQQSLSYKKLTHFLLTHGCEFCAAPKARCTNWLRLSKNCSKCLEAYSKGAMDTDALPQPHPVSLTEEYSDWAKCMMMAEFEYRAESSQNPRLLAAQNRRATIPEAMNYSSTPRMYHGVVPCFRVTWEILHGYPQFNEMYYDSRNFVSLPAYNNMLELLRHKIFQMRCEVEALRCFEILNEFIFKPDEEVENAVSLAQWFVSTGGDWLKDEMPEHFTVRNECGLYWEFLKTMQLKWIAVLVKDFEGDAFSLSYPPFLPLNISVHAGMQWNEPFLGNEYLKHKALLRTELLKPYTTFEEGKRCLLSRYPYLSKTFGDMFKPSNSHWLVFTSS